MHKYGCFQLVVAILVFSWPSFALGQDMGAVVPVLRADLMAKVQANNSELEFLDGFFVDGVSIKELISRLEFTKNPPLIYSNDAVTEASRVVTAQGRVLPDFEQVADTRAALNRQPEFSENDAEAENFAKAGSYLKDLAVKAIDELPSGGKITNSLKMSAAVVKATGTLQNFIQLLDNSNRSNGSITSALSSTNALLAILDDLQSISPDGIVPEEYSKFLRLKTSLAEFISKLNKTSPLPGNLSSASQDVIRSAMLTEGAELYLIFVESMEAFVNNIPGAKFSTALVATAFSAPARAIIARQEIRIGEFNRSARIRHQLFLEAIEAQTEYNLALAEAYIVATNEGTQQFGPLASTDCTKVTCTFTPDPNTVTNVDDKVSLGTSPPTPPVTSSGVWFGQLTGLAADGANNTFSDNFGVWSGGSSKETNKPIKGSLPVSIVDFTRGDDPAFSPSQVIVTQKDYFGPNSFSNLNDRTDGTYKYVAWGRWNSPVDAPLEVGGGYNFRHGYWVIGDQTKSQTILERQGEASYQGSVVADYIAEGTSEVRYGVVNGQMNLKVNFADTQTSAGSITGDVDLDINLAGTNESWLKAEILNGNIYTGFRQADGSLAGPYGNGEFLVQGKDSFNLDTVIEGGFTGYFFGPEGNEFGGPLHVVRDVHDELDGHAQGVFRTKCVVTPTTTC